MHQDSFVEMQPATDLFGLEFAVSQWERLVSDAEGLFHKLIENGLPKESRTQIEQWLCLKQECSDCLVSDENTPNFQEKLTRSLERIDEVTEYEEVSTEDRSSTCDESDVPDEIDSQLESDSIVEDDTATCMNSLSVVDNKMQDFEEKLEMFMQKFRLHTYEMVDNQFGTKHNPYLIENLEAIDNKANVQKGAVNNFRSKSVILPAQLNNTTMCQPNTEHCVIDDDCRNYLPDKILQINTNKSDDFSNLHHFNYYEKNITEKYKAIALNYEKRLQDLEIIKQLAGDSAKKVADMENNLQNSKKRMQKLVRLLKRTEEHKYSLEKTIIEDQKRINELEEKCKLQFSKTKFMDLNQKPAKEEKENLIKNDSQTYVDGSFKGSDKESLRQEIINLRKTREFLLEQRRSLDTKLNKDKVFTSAEERKFLELDEAIEAIDTAIEYKNEIICGHQSLPGDNSEREKGEEMLIQRLMNLSEQEMRSLLYKYFRKVVDLRESGRRLEQQLADQDHQIEAQTWKIRALSNAVQQAHIENERRLVMVHREHDEKLHLMFRHYGGQVTSNGGETSTGSSSLDRDIEKESIDSQQPIIQLQGALPKTVPTKAITIPQQNLKKLQGSLSTHTTKVTRKKNKLIIQQHKAKHIS